MALSLALLPGGLRQALTRLRDDLRALLGPELVSLWAHGATTLPDRPKCPGDIDASWSLHRAHWLAGRFVLLHGQAPTDLVIPPTWLELEQGLRSELADIDRVLAGGQNDLYHRAYVVANACRIIYSLDTRDVVVSKRAAAHWSLDHLPVGWHPAIQAAVRVYDGEASGEDLPVLGARLPEIVSAARARLS